MRSSARVRRAKARASVSPRGVSKTRSAPSPQSTTRRSCSRKGSRRRSSASATVKTATESPMPSARVGTAVAVNPGVRRRLRRTTPTLISSGRRDRDPDQPPLPELRRHAPVPGAIGGGAHDERPLLPLDDRLRPPQHRVHLLRREPLAELGGPVLQVLALRLWRREVHVVRERLHHALRRERLGGNLGGIPDVEPRAPFVPPLADVRRLRLLRLGGPRPVAGVLPLALLPERVELLADPAELVGVGRLLHVPLEVLLPFALGGRGHRDVRAGVVAEGPGPPA